MADGLDLSTMLRRTVQANARLYKGWVDLSLEYFRGISEIFGVAPEASAPAAEERSPGPGVVVIEGEEGTAARGAFLVTNDLARTVSCQLVSSPFVDPDGASVQAKVTFDPARLDLAPGEQRVVHAAISVDDKLSAGVAYTGEFAIKGMDGFVVPAVLRRLHRAEESPIDRAGVGASAAADPSAERGAARTKPAKKTRKPRAKRASRGKRAARQKD
jgi:hypothetical protein